MCAAGIDDGLVGLAAGRIGERAGHAQVGVGREQARPRAARVGRGVARVDRDRTVVRAHRRAVVPGARERLAARRGLDRLVGRDGDRQLVEVDGPGGREDRDGQAEPVRVDAQRALDDEPEADQEERGGDHRQHGGVLRRARVPRDARRGLRELRERVVGGVEAQAADERRAALLVEVRLRAERGVQGDVGAHRAHGRARRLARRVRLAHARVVLEDRDGGAQDDDRRQRDRDDPPEAIGTILVGRGLGFRQGLGLGHRLALGLAHAKNTVVRPPTSPTT